MAASAAVCACSAAASPDGEDTAEAVDAAARDPSPDRGGRGSDAPGRISDAGAGGSDAGGGRDAGEPRADDACEAPHPLQLGSTARGSRNETPSEMVQISWYDADETRNGVLQLRGRSLGPGTYDLSECFDVLVGSGDIFHCPARLSVRFPPGGDDAEHYTASEGTVTVTHLDLDEDASISFEMEGVVLTRVRMVAGSGGTDFERHPDPCTRELESPRSEDGLPLPLSNG